MLPRKLVDYVNSFTSEDYENDDLIYSISSIITDMQDLKEWEWYSSRELIDGFEVIVEGGFLVRFVWFVHCQGVSLSNISVKDDKDDSFYNLSVDKDVTSYK